MLADLRATGGDSTDIEVKSAAGGLPDSLTPTLSALANHPGGGTVLLGLDERNGFRPVELTDPQTLKQGLAKKARSLSPPVQLTIEDGTVDGAAAIVATVHECDPSAKPCRVAAGGPAYLRGYDGDFRMSDLEEQAFLASRQPPHFDRKTVPGATRDDLDAELVDDFARTVRSRDRRGLGRFEGDEMLRRAGVIDTDGVPTVAGLLALGTYPQQWFPRLVIQAAAEDPTDARATKSDDHHGSDSTHARYGDGMGRAALGSWSRLEDADNGRSTSWRNRDSADRIGHPDADDRGFLFTRRAFRPSGNHLPPAPTDVGCIRHFSRRRFLASYR